MTRARFVVFTNNPIGVNSLKRLQNNKEYSIIATMEERLISEEDKIVAKFSSNKEAEQYLVDYQE